jgi:hypothetical protein
MIKRVKNLFIDIGTDFYQRLSHKDRNNIPLSLEGVTIVSNIHNDFNNTDFPFVTEIINSSEFQISLPNTTTVLLKQAYYYYYIDIVSNNQRSRIYSGTIKVMD